MSIESEVDAVMKMLAERRERERQEVEERERARRKKAHEDLVAGKGNPRWTYPCGPCRNCTKSIILERQPGKAECLGHP